MNYFSNFKTVEQIKFNYRKLCSINHPDRGGNTETMQEINRQYKLALKSIDGQTSVGTDGAEHTYYYHADIESALMDKLNELFQLRMAEVEIALIGTWLWLLGSTRPYKDYLRNLGFRWHHKRKSWYFHTTQYRSATSSAELSDIAEKYGCKVFTDKQPVSIH